MTRLSYLDRASLPAEVATLWDRRPLNLYRVIAHARTAAPGFLALGRALLSESELDPKLRELVILRVGAISRATYEIYQHKRLAKSVGLSDDEIAAALRARADDCLPEFARLVLTFTESVVWEVKAPELLYKAVASQLSERQMAELLLTIGFYMLVSRFLENAEVEIEELPKVP
ncbi:MAG TPA: carboxymuconolactone decarboxylase family protein [Candidatus Angelobacter sp.]|nr:carboxymuconolactone decarboxylase family protein [Candidatus Angelobacter sp.]